jgi:hypothetical protein
LRMRADTVWIAVVITTPCGPRPVALRLEDEPGPWHDRADHSPRGQQINFFIPRSFLKAAHVAKWKINAG